MKKSIIFSAVVAAMLVGCNDAKEAVKHTTEKATEATKEVATKAVETTKEATSATAEATKEVAEKAVDTAKEAASATVEKAKEVATEAKETTEKKVEEAKTAVTEATTPKVDGKDLYVKTCAVCHGQNAEKPALQVSKVIGGWDAKKVEDALNGYKAGTYGGAQKGTMQGVVNQLDEAKIKALAEYISTLK